MRISVLIGLASVAALLAPWSAWAAPEVPFTPASPPVRVEYRKPKNPDHEALYVELRDRRVLERFEEIFSAFRLPRTLTLAFAGCDGDANAWYEAEHATVTSATSTSPRYAGWPPRGRGERCLSRKQLAAARPALGVCQAAISGWRPREAELQARRAIEGIQAARRELCTLFDRRVGADPLYGCE